MAIGYKYNSWKLVEFIFSGEDGITYPGDPYLSFLPRTHSNISINPFFPHILGRYFNTMKQNDIIIDKYWVKQSGYFRLMTIVALDMWIKYVNRLLCCGISEKIGYRKILMTD